ncbi:MAG TPA: hypothetical protein VIT91_19095 [Chthoniobacterales bacterium]
MPGATTPPAEPVKMKIFLTDTGYKTDFTSVVTPSRKGAPRANAAFIKINEFPARMLQVDSTTVVLNILVKSRYLFEIRATNLKADQLKKYAESFDFRKLRTAKDSGEITLSNPVILSRVDELNPKNNRSYPLFYNTAQ